MKNQNTKEKEKILTMQIFYCDFYFFIAMILITHEKKYSNFNYEWKKKSNWN